MAPTVLWLLLAAGVVWCSWRFVDRIARTEEPGPLRRQRRLIGFAILAVGRLARSLLWFWPWS